MSSRKKKDYEFVFRKVLEILPYTRAVKEIVSNFKKVI